MSCYCDELLPVRPRFKQQRFDLFDLKSHTIRSNPIQSDPKNVCRGYVGRRSVGPGRPLAGRFSPSFRSVIEIGIVTLRLRSKEALFLVVREYYLKISMIVLHVEQMFVTRNVNSLRTCSDRLKKQILEFRLLTQSNLRFVR